jgi:hypothetical protein
MGSPLEILVDERGCGELPCAVEYDLPRQYFHIIKRKCHEPDSRIREPIA